MVDALLPAAQVLLLGATVNAVVSAQTPSELVIYPLLFALLSAIGLVLTTLQGYWQASLEQRVSNTFNMRLMEKSASLSLPDFENSEVYNTLQLATREATSRPYMLFSQLIATVSGAISLLSVTGILLSWSPVVAILVLLSPILPVLVNQLFARKLWKVERGRSEERRRGQYLLALVTNDKTYKETRLFGLTQHFIDTYRAMLGRFYKVDMGIEGRRSVAGIVSGLVGVVVTGIAIAFAVSDSFAVGDVGRLASYISAIGAVGGAAQMLIGGIGQLVEHTLFLGNLFDFLDLPVTKKERGPQEKSDVLCSERGPTITFEEVCFTYPNQTEPALTEFSVALSAGKTVALVGENGAGKSTIVKLLARLYKPTSGRILLDGMDIEEIPEEAYRDRLAVLFQDFIQYEASLRENIAYGKIAEIEDSERVMETLRRANLEDVVGHLSNGIDTQLGKWFSAGVQLSGGQWQRVALARAMFRGASVIVLDEPTASLDARSEEAVFNQLRAEGAAATKVLISHRFSTARMADDILVLSQGRLIEQGTHSSLLSLEGLYAQMYRMQAKGYADEPVVEK